MVWPDGAASRVFEATDFSERRRGARYIIAAAPIFVLVSENCAAENVIQSQTQV